MSGPPQRLDVSVDTVRALIAAQFPGWAGLPVRPVDSPGWDNRSFRLGGTMLVRMPSAEPYALAVAKEQRWLPLLAPALPVRIPRPLARGVPGFGYPYEWSVYDWIDGTPAASITDPLTFATDLADFLLALQRVDPTSGPPPGMHNWYRGGPLTACEPWLRRADPAPSVWSAWRAAVAAPWDGRVRWFHGDVAAGNLLLRSGRLHAVIDFGTCGVGDPACDLAVAWTLLRGQSRAKFRTRMGVDDATWARGRGWALWKAAADGDDETLREVLTDHV